MSFRKLRRAARTRISTIPQIYLPLRRMLGYGNRLFDERTELVIEGFPRSGNSFSEAAFLFAQGREVPLGHHTHAAAHVIAAVRKGLPCLVVIRNPADACRSLVMTDPGVFAPENTLDEYRIFYDAIEPHLSGIVLARFETITHDFGLVCDAVNAKFATAFNRFDHTPENDAAAFRLLDQNSHERRANRAEQEAYSPHASEERRQAREIEKKRVAALFDAPSVADLLARADATYLRLKQKADV